MPAGRREKGGNIDSKEKKFLEKDKLLDLSFDIFLEIRDLFFLLRFAEMKAYEEG